MSATTPNNGTVAMFYRVEFAFIVIGNITATKRRALTNAESKEEARNLFHHRALNSAQSSALNSSMLESYTHLSSQLNTTIVSGNFTHLLNYYSNALLQPIYRDFLDIQYPKFNGPFVLPLLPSQQASLAASPADSTMNIAVSLVMVFLVLVTAGICVYYYRSFKRQKVESEKALEMWMSSDRGQIKVLKQRKRSHKFDSDTDDYDETGIGFATDYMYQPDMYELYDDSRASHDSKEQDHIDIAGFQTRITVKNRNSRRGSDNINQDIDSATTEAFYYNTGSDAPKSKRFIEGFRSVIRSNHSVNQSIHDSDKVSPIEVQQQVSERSSNYASHPISRFLQTFYENPMAAKR